MSVNGSNVVNSGFSQFSEKVTGSSNTVGATPPFQSQAAVDKQLSKKEVEREVENLNKFVQSSATHIKFTLHEGLNEYYVQVINDETNEVVKEIPSKKVMDMVAKMHEMIGLLVDEKR